MYSSVIVGKVVSTQDPDKLGRVQVQVLAYSTQVQVWMRLLMPYASATAGFVFLPEVDDEVLVLRGAGDGVDGMFVLGALYNGAHTPLYTNDDGANITKIIQTRSGNNLTISDKDGEEGITLKTKAGNLVALSDTSGSSGISIKNADGTIDIALDENGVSVTVANGKGATFTVAGDATLNAQGGVTVKGGTTVTVEAGTNLSCKGSTNATLEAGAQMKVTGGQVSVEGSALVQIKGAAVQIN